MKHIFALKAAAVLAVFATAAFSAPATNNTQTFGSIQLTGWKTLKLSETRVEASGGRTHLRDTGGTFEARADSIVANLNRSGKNKTAGMEALKNADLKGNVWIYYRPDPKQKPEESQWTKAAAASAHIDTAREVAELKGGVNIESNDPAVFDKPAILKGDTATISLKKQLAEGEPRVIVNSNERSHFEITPKAREANR